MEDSKVDSTRVEAEDGKDKSPLRRFLHDVARDLAVVCAGRAVLSRRRKRRLRTQPVIDAEARLGTRFARLGSLQNASPACAAVMAKLGSLSDV